MATGRSSCTAEAGCDVGFECALSVMVAALPWSRSPGGTGGRVVERWKTGRSLAAHPRNSQTSAHRACLGS